MKPTFLLLCCLLVAFAEPQVENEYVAFLCTFQYSLIFISLALFLLETSPKSSLTPTNEKRTRSTAPQRQCSYAATNWVTQ